jgi:DNA-binding beta-propeller fold protein YncE
MMLSGDSINSYTNFRYRQIRHAAKFFTLWLFVLFAFILLAGCETLDGGGGTTSYASQPQQFQRVEGGGWLSVFLNLKEPAGQEIALDLVAVEVKAGSNWFSLRSDLLIINAKKIGNGQIFIARNGLPVNDYDSLRLTFSKTVLRDGGAETLLTMAKPEVEMELPTRLSLRKGDSHSLFVTWDVSSSMVDAKTIAPAMNTALQAIPLIKDLNYIACPEIDTIYVIRTDKNWVISSLGVPGKPTYLDIDRSTNRIYVLTNEEYAINVIDIITNRIVDKFYIAVDNEPNFMTLSPDKRFAYILDQIGGNIVKMDLETGALAERATVFYKSQYALFLEDQNQLAISALDTNKVYLLDPENLVVLNSFTVGTRPQGLLSWRNFLFVAESGSNTVSSYNLLNYQQQARTNVGFSPRRLLLKNNQIYATNFMGGTITVMLPGQLNVSGQVPLGGTPLELAASESRRWLYVGDSDKGGVSVIDATSNRINRFIELQTLPVGMAVID